MTSKFIGIAWSEWINYYRSFIPELKLFQPGDNINNYKMMIFPGGGDVSPEVYGEKNTSSWFNQIRDEVEISILKESLEAGLKIFGVCRGHQLINACLGGKLIQDIKPHKEYHDISWMGNSDVSKFFPKHVNSLHHQGYSIPKISQELTAVAVEPTTGIVEVATNFKNIVTVQFHPEIMGSESAGFFHWLTTEFLGE